MVVVGGCFVHGRGFKLLESYRRVAIGHVARLRILDEIGTPIQCNDVASDGIAVLTMQVTDSTSFVGTPGARALALHAQTISIYLQIVDHSSIRPRRKVVHLDRAYHLGATASHVATMAPVRSKTTARHIGSP